MDIKEILKMSASRRILLAQEIWDSVPENSIKLSDSIKKELDNRLKSHEYEGMKYYTMEEVKNKLDEEKKLNE
jgi:putative addiction module component (TIGR02574 family)